MHFKIGFENDLIPIYTYLLLCRRRHRRRPVFFIKIKKNILWRVQHTHIYRHGIIFLINTEPFHLDCLFCLLDYCLFMPLCVLFVQNLKCCAKGELHQAFSHKFSSALSMNCLVS